MKHASLICLLVLIACLSECLGQEHFFGNGDGSFEESLSRLSFEEVDFTSLSEEARRRQPQLEDGDITWLVRSNLEFLIFNKLNRGRFLVVPKPQRVAEKVLEILRLHAELTDVVQRGRMLLAQGHQGDEIQSVIQEIGGMAQDLKKSFEEYFVDLAGASYVIQISDFEQSSAQFVHFLIQCEKILLMLSRQLDAYFLSESPGSVALADYENSSIPVLSECLFLLSKATRERIGK